MACPFTPQAVCIGNCVSDLGKCIIQCSQQSNCDECVENCIKYFDCWCPIQCAIPQDPNARQECLRVFPSMQVTAMQRQPTIGGQATTPRSLGIFSTDPSILGRGLPQNAPTAAGVLPFTVAGGTATSALGRSFAPGMGTNVGMSSATTPTAMAGGAAISAPTSDRPPVSGASTSYAVVDNTGRIIGFIYR
jgi:hypothetical protein